MSRQTPSRNRNRPPAPTPKNTRTRQSGGGGQQQAAQCGRVLLRLQPLLGGLRAQPAETAVGQPVQARLQIAAPGRPDVLHEPGVTAAHGLPDPPAGLRRRAVRARRGPRAGRHRDEQQRLFAAAEAGGEQRVPARLAPVARGVPAHRRGAQCARPVPGAVQHGVGHQVREAFGVGGGERGRLGVVGGRPGADVADGGRGV
ncbi:hypothetical protein GCM10020256_13530 [Streptomyces thermocoprophilus]